MNSPILNAVSRLVVGLMLLFSLFLLWRGHNAPGGGFIGGLVAAAGLIVYGLAEGASLMRRLLRVDPRTIVLVGVLVATVAGLLPLLGGQDFLTGLWVFIGATPDDKGLALGTPLLFDVGVYLTVVGGVSGLIVALEEDGDEEDEDEEDGDEKDGGEDDVGAEEAGAADGDGQVRERGR